MNRITTLLLFSIALFGLAGCLPKETPVPLFTSTASIDSVQMTASYNRQIFYSLADHRIVAQNGKAEWDLAFESGSDGLNVIINDAKAMYVWPTSCTDFGAFHWTDTLARRWDATNGDLSKSAMHDWGDSERLGKLYVVNCGLDAANRSAGSVLMQILQVDATGYNILFKAVTESGAPKAMRIPKNDECNYTYLSLEGGTQGAEIVTIEPPKKSWDLLFTQYTHYFFELPPPDDLHYTVTGCLLNPFNTKAGRTNDTTLSFEEINVAAINTAALSISRNTIGYDWKLVDINTSQYVVNSKKNFIISTSAGKLFKFHFIGFTTASGANGMPKFEFQEL